MKGLPSSKAQRIAACAISSLLLAAGTAAAGDPWLDGVADFSPGASAGFGADRMPQICLGPPRGFGLLIGSTHAVSLGIEGSLTAVFRDNVLVDGPGDDLIVFENAFRVGSEDGPPFDELGYVEVSPDGVTWYLFPADPETKDGFAGREPVLSSPGNAIDPLSPGSGGDRFDLADVGLSFARWIRFFDAGPDVADRGNLVPPGDKGGFDLDAAAAIHWVDPLVVRGTVTSGGEPVARAKVKLKPLDGTKKKWRWTNAAGRFRFRAVTPSGGYRLRVRRKGIGVVVQDLTLEAGIDPGELDVALD